MDWGSILASVQLASAAREARDQDERLERTRALLDRAFAEPLSIDALARHACLSREHYIRAFKRSYGLTPHQYLTRRRLTVARQLLRASDRSITDVCLDVGFSSVGSFSTLFKRELGHSPERYRRRLIACAGLIELSSIPVCFARRFGVEEPKSLFEKRSLRARG